jgi:A/G-specific adenine glycosylase
MRPTTPSLEARIFQRNLLRWFRRHGRDLPWRRTRNPYHIVVSEFMLQQTQVARVERFYGAFLARYPTLESLAAAPAASVRESWDGLGYYRRAANLHRLAQEVVEQRSGVIPSDPEDLRRLPGVGRYTAAAVASFAFERPVAPVDTNVARVLRRAFHPRAPRKALEQRLWASAELLLPRRGSTAWAFNQAIMELGALVCTARVPRCGKCPVWTVCKTGIRAAGERLSPASLRQTKRPGRRHRQSTPQCVDGHVARRSSGLPPRLDPADPVG